MSQGILADSKTMCADCKHNPALLAHRSPQSWTIKEITEHLRSCGACHTQIRAKGSAATREDAVGYEKLES